MSREAVNSLIEVERDILRLVAIGLPDDDIAERCGLTPEIVKTHLHIIFKKIEAPNRLQAMLWASQNL